ADDVEVIFYAQPVANAGADDEVCEDMEYDLAATPSVGTGTWTKTSGLGTAIFTPSANDPNATVEVSAYVSYILRWTVVNGSCTDSDSVTVNFYEQPDADAGSGGSGECDLDFTLDATPTLGATGEWTYTGPGTATFNPDANAGGATVTVTVSGSYIFT